MPAPDATNRRIWVDGALVPWERATVHVLGQSIQRGTLVFDFMGVYTLPAGPAIFGLREHVLRFVRSATLNGMRLRIGADEIARAIGETVRANPGAEFVKASAYWPGVGLDVLPTDPAPSIAIAAFGYEEITSRARPPADARKPARLQIADAIKLPASVLSPQVKIAAGYTHAAVAKARAREAGFDDILFLDARGDVAESSTQSFFLVDQRILRTAPLELVLDSITRRVVLELARDERIPVKEEPIPRTVLDSAEEAFLSGTTTDVWPVERVNERRFGPPVPGPVTKRLADRLARLLAGKDPEFSPRWMQPV